MTTMKEEMLAKLEEIKAKNQSKAPTPVKAKPKKIIKKDIQSDVDSYIELDAQLKALDKTLKAMRVGIEAYMITNNLDTIMGSKRGRITLGYTNRAIINARYTSYSIYDVKEVLRGHRDKAKILKDVVVEVVDKDMIDSYVKAGKIDKAIEELKMMNEGLTFSAKQI